MSVTKKIIICLIVSNFSIHASYDQRNNKTPNILQQGCDKVEECCCLTLCGCVVTTGICLYTTSKKISSVYNKFCCKHDLNKENTNNKPTIKFETIKKME